MSFKDQFQAGEIEMPPAGRYWFYDDLGHRVQDGQLTCGQRYWIVTHVEFPGNIAAPVQVEAPWWRRW